MVPAPTPSFHSPHPVPLPSLCHFRRPYPGLTDIAVAHPRKAPMRQHRIVGSTRHASQLTQSQGFLASQSHDTYESQRMSVPPPPPPPPPRQASASQRLQSSIGAYEVPVGMRRSLVRPPPPPPTPHPLATAVSARAHQVIPPDASEAQTRALLALTEVLRQTHREAREQFDASHLLRVQTTAAQEQLAAALVECVTELRALRGVLTSAAPPPVAPVTPLVPTQPRACRPRSSQLGINPVWRFAEAAHPSTLSLSASSPQLFPDPASGGGQRAKRYAPAHTQAGPVKARRAEPTEATKSARGAAESPEATAAAAAPSREESAGSGSGLSFFHDSEEGGIYLL